MNLIEVFLGLDPTVQVAFIGGLGGIGAAAFGLIKAWLDRDKPNDLHGVEKGPTLNLSDKDRAIVEKLTITLDQLSDAVERLRVQLDRRR